MKKLVLAMVAFFSGGLGLTKALVVEVVAAIFKRIAWKIVLERFLTRVLVACLVRIKVLNTNQIYQGAVDSIIKQLNEGGLTQAVAKRPRGSVDKSDNDLDNKKNE